MDKVDFLYGRDQEGEAPAPAAELAPSAEAAASADAAAAAE